MDSISAYKNRALASLDKGWSTPVICTLIYYIITFGVAGVMGNKDSSVVRQTVGFLFYLGLIPLGWSLQVLFLEYVREGRTQVNSLFLGFKKPWLPKSFLIPFLVGVYTVLWTLLLIIPGIIKAYSYAMAPYVFKDNPEISCDDAIKESMRLMDGHKLQLFLLDLSFIGWVILASLTLGIGFLWLVPYWQTTRVHFYEDLKKEMPAA